MKTRNFLLAAGVSLALALTFSYSEAQAAGQSDFYGVWVQGSRYFEINKESITIFRINSDDLEKSKYRIVKWEKESNKNFIVYTLSEGDGKKDFKVSIDAYSDLHISYEEYYSSYSGRHSGREYMRFEAKKSSAAELNKAIKEVAAKKVAREAAREAAKKAARKAVAQKIAKTVVQRSSFSDQRDGKTYKTVKIGSQTWMAENLNYDAKGSKCYGEDGKVIIEVMIDGELLPAKVTKTLSSAEVQANCKRYGRLYDWNTAKTACPSGWHLPNGDEWQKLVDITGGDELAGAYLKAKSGWDKNGNGTDELGFSALPGGSYGTYSTGMPSALRGGGSFRNAGNYGYWWGARESNYNLAYGRYISDDVGWRNYDKSHLHSVRCVQD